MPGAFRPWALVLVVVTIVVAMLESRVGARSGALPAASLELAAPSGCPTADEIRGAVAVRLGESPWQKPARQRWEVLITAQRRRYRAVIVMRDTVRQRPARRHVAAQVANCRDLLDPIALSIALAIDPFSGQRSIPRTTAQQAPASSQPTVVARRPAQRVATPPPLPSQRPALWLRAGGHLSVGVAPHATGGFQLGLALRWQTLSLSIASRVDLPASRELGGASRARSAFYGGDISPCYGGLGIDLCLTTLIGALRGEGIGLVGAQTTTLPYLAAGARLGYDLALGKRLAIAMHADILVTITRVSLDDAVTQASLWQAGPGSFALSMSIAGQLW